MELSKYTRYTILVPHHNGNIKLTGLHGERVRNKRGPTDRKHGCDSKIDIDLDIEPSGDNEIISDNSRSLMINPGILP